MKRDWDICKRILEASEAYDGRPLLTVVSTAMANPIDVIEYHLRILGDGRGNAGFIDENQRLTWAGQEALELMRNPAAFSAMKARGFAGADGIA